MLKVFICDDMIENTNMIENYVQRLSEECGIQSVITTFHHGYELLDQYTNDIDICILDIQMPDITGIEIAKKIREIDDQVTLVFMTNYAQYALEGFSVHAYQYLLKPVSYETFSKELKTVFQTLDRNSQYFLDIKNDQGVYRIPTNDIQYIETTVSKNCIIHYGQNLTCISYDSLKSLQETLKPATSFFRCHNSYIVNFSHIRAIQKDVILLNDGTSIPVSRHRKKELEEAYMSFLGGLI